MFELLERTNPDTLVGAVTAVVIILGVVVGLTYVIVMWDLRRQKLYFEERRAFIDKGLAPPPERAKTPEETMAMWGMYTSKMQRQRLLFEERRIMIEKGMTPPPLLTPETPEQYRRKGIVTAFLGLGMSVGYFALTPENSFKELIGFTGPVLVLLGIGFIVYSLHRKVASPAGN